MTTPHTHVDELAQEVRPPDQGIPSRTLVNDDPLKVVMSGFAHSDELSEHTASMPAALHCLQGEAKPRLGDDPHEAQAGTGVHRPAGLRHSIRATTLVVVLLMLLK